MLILSKEGIATALHNSSHFRQHVRSQLLLIKQTMPGDQEKVCYSAIVNASNLMPNHYHDIMFVIDI